MKETEPNGEELSKKFSEVDELFREKKFSEIISKIDGIIKVAKELKLDNFLSIAQEKLKDIIAEAQKNLLLIEKAKKDKDYDVVKIIVDGNTGVGKTTMLRRLIENKFYNDTELTVGIEFFVMDYNLFGKSIKAAIWDLSGPTRFDYLRPFCYRGANCVVLVSDLLTLEREQSSERIDYYMTVAQNASITSNQIILVGNKKDLLSHTKDSSEIIKSCINKYGLSKFLETSAKEGENINNLFELAVAYGMHNKGLINTEELQRYK